MKKLLSALLAVMLLMTCAECGAEQEIRLDAEGEIRGLTKVEGSIYMNDDPAYGTIGGLLLRTVSKPSFRGSLIVATDDAVIFASGTHLTDTDGKEVTPFTVYEIGSLTKSFVAVCVMKLAEEGRLSLSDTLGDFFPEYGGCSAYEQFGGITVSDLMRMRSGIPDYLNAPDLFFGEAAVGGLGGKALNAALYDETFVNGLLETVTDDADFLTCMFSSGLIFAPGTAYAYSNTNYRVLAVIIERVTGMPYAEYVDETVFAPCGMNSSSAMAEDGVTASAAPGSWRFINAGTKGAGDIFSSAADLLKYDRALFGGLLLGEDAMKELLTPEEGYACGWYVQEDTLYHTGGTPAFASYDSVTTRDGKRLYIICLADQGENRGREIQYYLDSWFGR